jgi:hypothetical protein
MCTVAYWQLAKLALMPSWHVLQMQGHLWHVLGIQVYLGVTLFFSATVSLSFSGPKVKLFQVIVENGCVCNTHTQLLLLL